MLHPESGYSALLFFHFGKAFTAVNRAAFSRLERHFARGTAISAHCIVHFMLRLLVHSAGFAAFRASFGFIGKTLLRVKFLFTGSPNKLLPAFLAD